MSVLGRVRQLPLWRPLEKPSFRFLWLGAGASLLADQAFMVGLTWLVLQVAGSGVELGTVLAVASIPGILLMPLGGVLSDRFSPAPVMIFASIGCAILLAGLAGLVLLEDVRLWHIYLLAGGLSALDALYYPASRAIIPSLVERRRLGAANALIQGAEQVSGIAGPALAVSSVAFLGLGVTFGANGCVFLAAAAMFACVMWARRFRPWEQRVGEDNPRAGGEHYDLKDNFREPGLGSENTTSLGASLFEGVRYAWSDPIVRAMLLILMGVNAAMIGPLYVGGATLAQTRLGGAGAFGTLVSVAGIGSVLGLLAAGSIERLRRRGLTVLIVTAVLGFAVAAVAFVTNLVLAAILACVIGASASFLGVTIVSWLQERSESRFTGRLMSLVMLAAVSLDPISFTLAGLLAELNLMAVFLAAGALLLLTAALGLANRTVRKAD